MSAAAKAERTPAGIPAGRPKRNPRQPYPQRILLSIYLKANAVSARQPEKSFFVARRSAVRCSELLWIDLAWLVAIFCDVARLVAGTTGGILHFPGGPLGSPARLKFWVTNHVAKALCYGAL